MSTTEPSQSRWLQVNVALRRPDGGGALASARAVFAELAPRLEAWRADGVLDGFHFMRKPPDLRLRFEGPDPRATLWAPLEALLTGMRDAGAVERFFPSVYEPETRLFGGPAAMDCVHAFFDADTAGWMAVDRLWGAGAATPTAELLTAAVVNDFCTRLLDGAETWDVWCNLAALVAPPDAEPAALDPLRPTLRALTPRAGTEERRALDGYADATAALATGLDAAWSGGHLTCGLRAVLAYVALFHLHRYGLGRRRQAALGAAMQAAWDPHRGLRGGEPALPRSPQASSTSSRTSQEA